VSTFEGVADPMKYDFGRWAKAKGAITEPNSTQVGEFGRAMLAHQRRVNDLLPQLGGEAPENDRLAALEQFSTRP
jgi:hypothetical protein